MERIPPHIAIHHKLIAYDTGRTDRIPYQVIKIRNNTNRSIERAGIDKHAIPDDDTGAGHGFSPAELDIRNALSEQLVVVVGEFLPQPLGNNSERKLAAREPLSVDPAVNEVVPTTRGTRLVVRRLADERRCVLHVLHNKKDGLCCVVSLPRRDITEGQIVYFPEWTAGPVNRKASLRTDAWGANVTTFVREYLNNYQADAGEPPAMPSAIQDRDSPILATHAEQSPASCASFIPESHISEDDSRQPLEFGSESATVASHQPEDQFDHREAARVLIHGTRDYDIHQAREAARAFIVRYCTFPVAHPSNYSLYIEVLD